MKTSARRLDVAGLLLALAVAGCGAATQGRRTEPVRPTAPTDTTPSPAAQARADSGRPAYTAADVRFMHGMIAHHAQALQMTRWAATHSARADVRILAERIDVSQRDEIATMQRWLRERRETVPDPIPHLEHGGMGAPGTLMPGMLTADELAQLERARGAEFDRLFLAFMIRHHQGALTMVEQLFSSPGAGQDVTIFRFASDVSADQTAEIDRMRAMLASLGADRSRP